MPKKYKIGYALSGGGAKGFAHAGAIKALEELGFHPDIISGTSAGAVVGAFYAAGFSPEEIVHAFTKYEFMDFVQVVVPKAGLFKTSKAVKFFKKEIPYVNIEDLPVPVKIVSTDFDHGKSVVFEQGELAPRLMASSCVPVVFEPIKVDGIRYVDGGVFRNFPVAEIRHDCDMVIGINVSPLVADKYSLNMVSIAERSYEFLFRANTMEDRHMCDFLLEIDEALKFKTFDLKSAEAIFKLGYTRMKEHTDELKSLL